MLSREKSEDLVEFDHLGDLLVGDVDLVLLCLYLETEFLFVDCERGQSQNLAVRHLPVGLADRFFDRSEGLACDNELD